MLNRSGLPEDDGRENRLKTEYARRPTWAEIDLRALEHNLRQAQRFCQPQQRLLTVVKADAYGHGAVPVSRCFAALGVEHFGVATLEEALELRAAGIDGTILVLGGCYAGQEAAFLQHALTPALLDPEMAQRVATAAARQGREQTVHLKIDSGMGRVGFLPEQLREFLPQLKRLKGLRIEGVMSHLACADEPESAVTSGQLRLFREQLQLLRAAGLAPREIHLSNSAGLVGWDFPEATLARPGIMLYGGLPGPAYADRLELKPVMQLRSRIAQLRWLPEGSGVSYGHNYHAARPTRVAVLPIGYADGYNRLFSNRGQAILHGRKIPLIGRVCMDWIMFDVTDLPQTEVGDCVTLLGAADGLTTSGDEWAETLHTISYEVFCRIGSRVPRIYPAVPE